MLKQLTIADAETLIASGNVVIADIRDHDSYEEAHIVNAINLSMPKLQDFIASVDKIKPILVYCYHGISSQSVARHLIEQGFKTVYSLVGGYEMWKTYHASLTDPKHSE